MSNRALLIKSQNNNNNFICNICSSSIENDKIIGLKCNSKKHIFCYDCIMDWYLEIKNSLHSTKYSNYNFIHMCPICRKNGGLLPNLNNNFISDIHYTFDDNRDNMVQTCGYEIKDKDDYCMCLGKKNYNNLCKKHFKIETQEKNILIKNDFINSVCTSLYINKSLIKLKVNELRKIVFDKEIHMNPSIFKKNELVMILSNKLNKT